VHLNRIVGDWKCFVVMQKCLSVHDRGPAHANQQRHAGLGSDQSLIFFFHLGGDKSDVGNIKHLL
jgi:hypothetical protein